MSPIALWGEPEPVEALLNAVGRVVTFHVPSGDAGQTAVRRTLGRLLEAGQAVTGVVKTVWQDGPAKILVTMYPLYRLEPFPPEDLPLLPAEDGPFPPAARPFDFSPDLNFAHLDVLSALRQQVEAGQWIGQPLYTTASVQASYLQGVAAGFAAAGISEPVPEIGSAPSVASMPRSQPTGWSVARRPASKPAAHIRRGPASEASRPKGVPATRLAAAPATSSSPLSSLITASTPHLRNIEVSGHLVSEQVCFATTAGQEAKLKMIRHIQPTSRSPSDATNSPDFTQVPHVSISRPLEPPDQPAGLAKAAEPNEQNVRDSSVSSVFDDWGYAAPSVWACGGRDAASGFAGFANAQTFNPLRDVPLLAPPPAFDSLSSSLPFPSLAQSFSPYIFHAGADGSYPFTVSSNEHGAATALPPAFLLPPPYPIKTKRMLLSPESAEPKEMSIRMWAENVALEDVQPLQTQ